MCANGYKITTGLRVIIMFKPDRASRRFHNRNRKKRTNITQTDVGANRHSPNSNKLSYCPIHIVLNNHYKKPTDVGANSYSPKVRFDDVSIQI